jgi:hypothetical protein
MAVMEQQAAVVVVVVALLEQWVETAGLEAVAVAVIALVVTEAH